MEELLHKLLKNTTLRILGNIKISEKPSKHLKQEPSYMRQASEKAVGEWYTFINIHLPLKVFKTFFGPYLSSIFSTIKDCKTKIKSVSDI